MAQNGEMLKGGRLCRAERLFVQGQQQLCPRSQRQHRGQRTTAIKKTQGFHRRPAHTEADWPGVDRIKLQNLGPKTPHTLVSTRLLKEPR